MDNKEFSEEKIVNIAQKCAGFLVEKSAKDVMLIDLKKINSYLDYFVISTGNSHIHCTALAKGIQKLLKEIGLISRTTARLDTGWIALDYNEIVIHMFTQEKRDFYQLEKLWADADLLSF